MTLEGDAAGVPVAEAPPPAEPMLPLRELDRALAPLRRVVRYALDTGRGAGVRFFEANARRHLQRALALELPSALREPLEEADRALSGFDADQDGRAERLSVVYAHLTRVDALVGLPLHLPLRPVQKVRQVDQPEARPEAPPAPKPAGPRPPAPERPPVAVVERAERPTPVEEPADDEEDEEGPVEWAGDLSQPLADLVPELAEALSAAGLETVRDLMLRRPTVVERLEPIHGAGREMPEGRLAAGGRLQGGWTVLQPDGTKQRWSRLVGAGPVRVRWADPELAPWQEEDRRVVVAGTLVGSEPPALVDAEVVVPDGATVRLGGWSVPGVPDRALRGLWSVLAEALPQVRDPVSPEVLRRLELPALGPAIAATQQRLDDGGRRRFAFDEMLLVQAASVMQRQQPGRDRGLSSPVLNGFAGRMAAVADLVLDDSAQACLEEIKRDLRRSVPMRRVVTGEVGAGKGAVALFAAAMVAESKAQVVFLCSDLAEAEQRFLHSEALLRDGGLVARLVTTPPGRAQRDALKRGEVHVVFSTHDLLEHDVEFRRLGLVVAIERERWGRVSALHHELPAPRPDLLVLTAVPVGPRVLLTAYADHHVSVVVDAKRRPARIQVRGADQRDLAYGRIREVVEAGDQALVVFPMVDGQDAVEIPGALRLVRALEADALAGLRVGLLHGAMPREERARVGEDFVHRRLDVLISTTRIEDGPRIPGACVLVIEQADRVDQWRLHRLIGFLSRSRRPAEAILVVGEQAEPGADARIGRVATAPNGFQLTEELVALQGVQAAVSPGAAPLPRTTWFEPAVDLDLLLAARDEAHRLVRADPGLRRGAHADLARELRLRWDTFWPEGSSAGPCPVGDDLPPPEPRKRRRRRRRKRG